jgi:ABC-type cobalamin transport system ATPase subunit
VRSRLPAAIATLHEITPESPTTTGATSGGEWVRVRIRAERLDCIPALLASLDRAFVIEHPESLRDSVHCLASRLATYADATA